MTPLTSYTILPIPYQALTCTLGDEIMIDLAAAYKRQHGIICKHWCVLNFESGCIVPIPTQYDEYGISAVRACRVYMGCIEEVLSNELHAGDELDNVTLELAYQQLQHMMIGRAVTLKFGVKPAGLISQAQ